MYKGLLEGLFGDNKQTIYNRIWVRKPTGRTPISWLPSSVTEELELGATEKHLHPPVRARLAQGTYGLKTCAPGKVPLIKY